MLLQKPHLISVHSDKQAIKFENTDKLTPVFDSNKKVRSTADMPTWYTTKPCMITKTSHISHCVFDSAWESTESYIIEKN